MKGILRSLATAAVLVMGIGVDAVVADSVRCREEITKASAKLVQARLKAIARCEDKIVRGKASAASDCGSDPKTTEALAKAEAKMRSSVAKQCGGSDRVCGTADDDALDAVGWDARVCSDFGDSDCTGQISHCGEIADCIACVGAATVDRTEALTFAKMDLGSAPRSDLEKCQAEIGKATNKYAAARSKLLQKCWTKVSKGVATAPCPSPGDGRTAEKLASLEEKFARSICKRCGGADRGCDDSVATLIGTGGEDDLLPAEIGFPANCPEVFAADDTSCAAPVSELADAVTCLACSVRATIGCADRMAVPWAAAYPGDCSDLVYAERFFGADGGTWPQPWTGVGSIDTADLLGDAARFRPTISGYSLARMYADFAETDVEATFTFSFTDDSSQGVGFYVRSNGGYLQQSAPAGQGYAVFIEKFRPDPVADVGIGLWYEENGNEIPLQIDYGTVSVDADERYRVRFRVHQSGSSETVLRAKLWPENGLEPGNWTITYTDANPVLQNLSGGFAFDNWSDHTDPNDPASHLFVDDVVIRRLRNPLSGVGPVTPVQETFVFAEGPEWRVEEGVLYFSDIGADTIYRLTPPATVDVVRTPSDGANGLATAADGRLLAAEHTTRRVSVTDSGGAVSTLVDTYQGLRFNSPNDIAVRYDGTVYFTDPIYGLANPAEREIPFNGLFRVAPGGVAVAEWEGDAASTGPNGLALSPDEDVLYMADTEAGAVLAWDVAADGSLTDPRTFASGTTIPDGLAVDVDGNVYVATWGNTVEVFAPSGDRWGSIAVPGTATNCGFGDADLRTLYITTQSGLYRVAMPIAGLR